MPNARQFHEWAFRHLYEHVSYRAEEHGIHAEQADPTNTAARCSSCGSIRGDGDNRSSQDVFCCQSCGYEIHADYDAAKSIGYHLSQPNWGRGRHPQVCARRPSW